VFREAVKRNAAAIILAHNHPSGEADATKNDIRATREAIEVGKNLGMPVLDHVIVGDEIFSMKKSAPVEFLE
jgi:DNA repair protein RadC